MSALENTLRECGILQPLQQLIDKNKDIDVWTMNLISFSAIANQCGSASQYKEAIRHMHQNMNAVDENICGQPYSSPESEEERTGERKKLKEPIFSMREHSSLQIEEHLPDCGVRATSGNSTANTNISNVWKVVLNSMENLADQNDQAWAFKAAIELQWKQLKHKLTLVLDGDSKVSGGPTDCLPLRNDLETDSENPYLAELETSETGCGPNSKIKDVLKNCGVLEDVEKSISITGEVSCLDFNLIVIENLARACGMQEENRLAIIRRANDLSVLGSPNLIDPDTVADENPTKRQRTSSDDEKLE